MEDHCINLTKVYVGEPVSLVGYHRAQMYSYL